MGHTTQVDELSRNQIELEANVFSAVILAQIMYKEYEEEMNRKGNKIKGGITMEHPMLYTVKEVAGLLKTSPDTVYALYHAGILPMLKLGSLKCRRETLEEFLKKYEGYDVSKPDHIVPLAGDNSEAVAT